jgi:tRNA (guanine37-N1)-methyltransferase
MISGFFNESIIKRAIDKKIVDLEIINLRDFAKDKYKSVDDKPYGGGVGMVLKPDILFDAIKKAKKDNDKTKIILTSPKGKIFDQKKAKEYSNLDHLILIAGHYEGADDRIKNFIDEEISIGDFILTGGEIPASCIVDSIVRLIPGVLKKQEASKNESFFEIDVGEVEKIIGKNETINSLKKRNIKKIKLLEYPQYTRPKKFLNLKVPEVLLSGDHKKIREWRLKKAFKKTLKKRPDLLK